MFCPRCGKENDDTARYCQACGNGLQPAVTPSPATGVARYAAFWERFVAQVIDAVILSVATGTVFTATFGAGMAIGFFAPWLYEAFMTSSEWQATVGKRVMSIVVTDLNGNRMSFARATGRHFAKYISVFLLGIGFVIAAFTAKKQALHDMIAETLVMKH
ncbi:MAG: hypothetical protein DMG19_14785 [Acidobacteria bacterium]|nr:MAG: hypothetical protein DMG19_14785 [Acidobacteriota bacterium]PYS09141.1 MAG: hypothetical protein DMG17_27595 [Acidobacteriota bacterium]